MTIYLYRLGDGNEGNYPRALVNIADDECPFAGIAALVVNRYIPGSRTRRYIMREIQTYGEREYGISATVYEGPNGEQAFDSSWITAELEPLTDADVKHYEGQGMRVATLRESLDRGALMFYRKKKN